MTAFNENTNTVRVLDIIRFPDIMFLGTTPANRPDSPEYMPRGGESEFMANQMSLHDEAARKDAESDDTLDDE